MKVRYTINKKREGAFIPYNEVDFFYGYGKSVTSSRAPSKQTYSTLIDDVDTLLVGLNYTRGDSVNATVLGRGAGISQAPAPSFQQVSIYKREIWEDGGEDTYSRVALHASTTGFYDFNVANNRTYEYLIYPEFLDSEGATLSGGINVRWNDWSITELHPVSGNKKRFTAQPSDVWILKYNVEPTDQTQNISKTQQDNLTAYPKFSHGPKNHVTSSVTCLLGSQMLPYDFITSRYEYVEVSRDTWAWRSRKIDGGYQAGGYTEAHPFVTRLTSNQQVDMLNAWRRVAYSGNPKLVKDRKGQKFLVQITDPSNTVADTWNKMPVTISFSWVEIGSLDDVIITSPLD